MTPSDDLSPPRRPIFFPVVIATVFLTIIGLTAGFVLGERRKNEARAAQPGPASTPNQPAIWTPPPTPAGELCPVETREFAAAQGFPADLRQVLRIETDNRTVVWICQDADEGLYYQGKTPRADGQLVQNQNGLFLPGVTELATGEYQARATNGNRIIVSREMLEIRFTSGKVEKHKVVAAD
ncbi:hypothetical protein HH310_31110 [Actinoplanes sp. TBRC 11911]|uniref:hypothetical protein n=1 Tax=Actinoplanes sp. TBRC 11911 TaxID=2729386 RepID=UPI00145CF610|nr:hypothetical protein [Actinoplanes sp. TBRC 11911]NMO55621.1 hypothetical protein [Actinoplanes sp. TBRC 11911]